MQYNSGKESVKQLAGKQAQVSQPNKSHKKIWVAIVIISVVVVVAVVLWIVLSGNGDNGSGNGGGSSYKFPAGATFEDKLKICLENELGVQECYLAYDDSESSLPLCENMGELRDKCIYNVAVANDYSELCGRINSAELQG